MRCSAFLQLWSGGKSTFNARFPAATQKSVPVVNQWFHVAMTADQFGALTFYRNGQAFAAGTAAGLPMLRQRNACRVGADTNGARGFNGLITAFNFWNYPLTAQEVQWLAADPPASIQQSPVLVVGMPDVAAAQGHVISPIRVSVQLVSALPVELVITAAGAGGSATTTGVALFSGSSPALKTVSLTLPPVTANQTSWTISYELVGPGAAFYRAPTSAEILVQTYEVTLRTAKYSLLLDAPSANAGFRRAPGGNSGVATFNGQQVGKTKRGAHLRLADDVLPIHDHLDLTWTHTSLLCGVCCFAFPCVSVHRSEPAPGHRASGVPRVRRQLGSSSRLVCVLLGVTVDGAEFVSVRVAVVRGLAHRLQRPGLHGQPRAAVRLLQLRPIQHAGQKGGVRRGGAEQRRPTGGASDNCQA